MKYDTQAMAEVLCKTAGVEYSSDLEKLSLQPLLLLEKTVKK